MKIFPIDTDNASGKLHEKITEILLDYKCNEEHPDTHTFMYSMRIMRLLNEFVKTYGEE